MQQAISLICFPVVGSETLQYERETLQHGEGDGAASEAHRQHGHGKVKYLGEEGESTPAAGVTFICSPWELLVIQVRVWTKTRSSI